MRVCGAFQTPLSARDNCIGVEALLWPRASDPSGSNWRPEIPVQKPNGTEQQHSDSTKITLPLGRTGIP
jgi:hypothetical protein